MNIIALSYMILGLASSGIYAFLLRSPDANDSLTRANQLVLGDWDPTDLNDVDSLTEWLSETFLYGVFDFDSFADTCSLTSMRADAYTYGLCLLHTRAHARTHTHARTRTPQVNSRESPRSPSACWAMKIHGDASRHG